MLQRFEESLENWTKNLQEAGIRWKWKVWWMKVINQRRTVEMDSHLYLFCFLLLLIVNRKKRSLEEEWRLIGSFVWKRVCNSLWKWSSMRVSTNPTDSLLLTSRKQRFQSPKVFILVVHSCTTRPTNNSFNQVLFSFTHRPGRLRPLRAQPLLQTGANVRRRARAHVYVKSSLSMKRQMISLIALEVVFSSAQHFFSSSARKPCRNVHS